MPLAPIKFVKGIGPPNQFSDYGTQTSGNQCHWYRTHNFPAANYRRRFSRQVSFSTKLNTFTLQCKHVTLLAVLLMKVPKKQKTVCLGIMTSHFHKPSKAIYMITLYHIPLLLHESDHSYKLYKKKFSMVTGYRLHFQAYRKF